jgi:3-isopropylmalate/(R)-2-methylmalate dehydratase small subunit
MEPIRQIRSRTVALPSTNIDTDQIIPARFLRTTTREGLGEHLFSEWRYAPDGTPRSDFVLNTQAAVGCTILVAGRNFGCGSSREHAPWALLDYGFRAVVSSEIADIFRNNSLKNGLLPVVVDEATVAWLLERPGAAVTIDVERGTLTLPDGRSAPFPLDGFERYCLLNGVDELGFLLSQQAAIETFERGARERGRAGAAGRAHP